MEPGPGAPQALTPGETRPDDTTWRFRARLVAACVVLVGLALVQSPGLLVPDTKLDLAIAPLDFLQRAAHLWDAEGAFGQLQNQAYGYLWPMGPFFVLGNLIDLPGWIVQRLWLALVMCVAFTGTAKLSRVLGVRSDLACIVAGLAFALSPRMLTTLGPISIEAWPSALAPWVLLPLVIGSTRGSPRRAAALSALAIAMVGGVNAAATAAVLPLGAWWLLTRTPGPRRRSMMIWWPVFTTLGTLWWLVPLFVMGAYSPPFLDYIESAANTTFSTTMFDALRGTSNWVPYVDASSRAGNDLISSFYLPLNSGVLLVAGLAGMMLRRNPHRVFLAGGLTIGLLLVTMGHTGAVQGWFAPQLQELLDGPLAPLRNVHKFDVVVRLPMVIGLAWAVEELVERALTTPHRAERVNFRALAGILVFATLAAALPAAMGRITPSGGFQSIPDYWREAASWLGEEQDEGVALLSPGSSFGTYAWGSPRDEPLQALAENPWAVRNAVPLTNPGNIRMLDAIEERMFRGQGSDGLARFLRRSGVSHLVVRNDLARGQDIADPVLVHQALNSSPGLARVASFGPAVGGEAHLVRDDRRVMINGGWQDEYPAIEIYAVEDRARYAVAGGSRTTVVGGPEDLLDLVDLGLLDDGPTVLANDLGEGPPTGRVILTDGQRAVERHFGRLHDNVSETLTRGQPARLQATVRDYVLDDPERWSTHATFEGIESVTASSALSDPSAGGGSQPGRMPFAALDGVPETSWSSAQLPAEQHWWRVDFGRDVDASTIEVQAGPDADQEIRVETAGWKSEPIRIQAGESAVVHPPGAVTEWVRIKDVSGRQTTSLSIAEVSVPAVHPSRSLELPRLPAGSSVPDEIVLRAVDSARTGCAVVEGAVRCVPHRQVDAEEPFGFSRRVTMPTGSSYPTTLLVAPRPGDAFEDLVMQDRLFGIRSSSTGNPDVRASALAAVDGDPGTTWTADLDDLAPTLSLNWLQGTTVRGIRVEVAEDTAARAPLSLLLRWPGGRRVVEVDEEGEVDFRPIRTRQLTISVQNAETVTSLGFDGTGLDVPIGISELRVVGLPFLPAPPTLDKVRYPCGSGPIIEANGRSWQTAVAATPAELQAGRVVEATLCGGGVLPLQRGDNVVRVSASEAFTPRAVLMGPQQAGQAAMEVRSQLDGPVRRTLEAPDDALTATRENANRGWHGERSGDTLRAEVVDGWRQGWHVDGESRSRPLDMSFKADIVYRWGLALGGLGLILLCLSIVTRRWNAKGTDFDVLGAARPHPALLVSAALVGAGVLGGTTGLLVALATAAVVAIVTIRAPSATASSFVAAVIIPAAVAYAVRPWGDPNGWAGDLAWPAYLVVASSSGVLTVLALWSARPTRLFRRKAGISTRK